VSKTAIVVDSMPTIVNICDDFRSWRASLRNVLIYAVFIIFQTYL